VDVGGAESRDDAGDSPIKFDKMKGL
jgi:hypothetical protein